MATLDDVQLMAYNAVTLPPLQYQVVDAQTAIFKFWRDNKDVGVPVTAEIALADGTTALVTSSGRVLHWLGGEQVEVV
jgi:hypothetical protein